jgi:hypothetical protein
MRTSNLIIGIVLPDGSIKHIRNFGHPKLNVAGNLTEFLGTAVGGRGESAPRLLPGVSAGHGDFCHQHGLRCGDVFDLKWEEVDFEQKRLNVVMGKTQRSLEVPLNDVACEMLRAWEGMKTCSFVFYNLATSDRFRDVKAGLGKAAKEAGLDKVTWHTFRHTFASRLTRDGADIVAVKELLGHSTITVTMCYAHANEETKARAVKCATSSDSSSNAMKSGKIEDGGMGERLKPAVLKTVSGVTRSGVRIPLPPPVYLVYFQ